MNNVFINGMGIVSAHGIGLPVFTQALKEGKSSFLINDFPLERRQTLPSQTALYCVEEALRHASLDVPPEKIGIIIGGQNINQQYNYENFKLYENTPDLLLPSYAVQFMDTDLIGLLSEKFNIRGEGYTIGGASASGNMAIIQGYRLIKAGIIDACVVVGALAHLSPVELKAFKNYGALSCEEYCRPFDEAHKGFVYGQAAGCLVLSSRPQGIQILGTGICLDANRFAEPNAEGEATAMRKALQEAKKNPDDIDYLNPHGTGSILGDKTEIEAIKKVFGNHTETVWMNTTKSLTGHCLWSAGVIEAIATVIQMQQHFLHPNPYLDNPIEPTFNFVGKKFIPADIKLAMSNNYGFGGINTSIILGA